MYLPYAKTISVLALLPLVMFYTRLLETTSREKMLILLPTFYGVSILIFSVVMFVAQAPSEEIAMRSLIPYISTKILGYLWYFFVESFGSLFNMFLNPLQTAFGIVAGRMHYLTLSGAIGFPLLAVWFLVAIYLAKKFQKGIQENKVVC